MDEKLISIPKSKNDDPFYRYKREMIHFDEASFSKLNYRWKNFDKIMSQVDINKDHFLKKFKKLTNQRVKENNGSLYMASINLPYEEYETFLEEYILMFVCCDICSYPELMIGEKGKKVCKACGAVKEKK